jgi:hypothetical protein
LRDKGLQASVTGVTAKFAIFMFSTVDMTNVASIERPDDIVHDVSGTRLHARSTRSYHASEVTAI